jgi:hypothetical protein
MHRKQQVDMDVCFLVVFILAYCLLLFQMADNTVRVLLILYSVKLKHDVDWVHIHRDRIRNLRMLKKSLLCND